MTVQRRSEGATTRVLQRHIHQVRTVAEYPYIKSERMALVCELTKNHRAHSSVNNGHWPPLDGSQVRTLDAWCNCNHTLVSIVSTGVLIRYFGEARSQPPPSATVFMYRRTDSPFTTTLFHELTRTHSHELLETSVTLINRNLNNYHNRTDGVQATI